MHSNVVRFLSLIATVFLFGGCPPPAPSGPPAVVSFAAATPTVCTTGQITLNWVVSDATSVSIDNGVGDVSGKISVPVNVATTTTFTLTAKNDVGTTTKATTVTVNAFPRQPFGSAASTSTAAVITSADRTALAFAANGQMLICRGGACANHTVTTDSLFWSSTMGSVGVTPLASLGADFIEFANTTGGLKEYVDVNGTFAAGQLLPGMTNSVPLRIAVDIPDNRLAIAATDGPTNALQFAELAGGIWSLQSFFQSGLPLTNVVVFGAGYAADGTAWLLYSASNVLTLQRRAGAVWQVVASHTVNASQTPSYIGGSMTAATPDGKTLLAVWGSNSASTDSAQAVTIDLTTNTFGTVATLLGPVTITSTNFSTSVSVSADGKHASYVLATGDGRAWVGTWDAASNTFSPAQTFHPELVIGVEPRVIHDSCDQALVVYAAAPTVSAPHAVFIDPTN